MSGFPQSSTNKEKKGKLEAGDPAAALRAGLGEAGWGGSPRSAQKCD